MPEPTMPCYPVYSVHCSHCVHTFCTLCTQCTLCIHCVQTFCTPDAHYAHSVHFGAHYASAHIILQTLSTVQTRCTLYAHFLHTIHTLHSTLHIVLFGAAVHLTVLLHTLMQMLPLHMQCSISHTAPPCKGGLVHLMPVLVC